MPAIINICGKKVSTNIAIYPPIRVMQISNTNTKNIGNAIVAPKMYKNCFINTSPFMFSLIKEGVIYASKK